MQSMRVKVLDAPISAPLSIERLSEARSGNVLCFDFEIRHGYRVGEPMSFLRYVAVISLWVLISIAVDACDTPRGDKNVQTEPAEGSSEGPGLFTGKQGGIVIETDPWTGASPYGDTSE